MSGRYLSNMFERSLPDKFVCPNMKLLRDILRMTAKYDTNLSLDKLFRDLTPVWYMWVFYRQLRSRDLMLWGIHHQQLTKETQLQPYEITFINTLRPRQNGQHFADDIFKRFSSMKMFGLSEPMMFILLTHICVTRPQWVNTKIDKSGNHLNIHHQTCSSKFTTLG